MMKERDKLEKNLGGIKDMERLPGRYLWWIPRKRN